MVQARERLARQRPGGGDSVGVVTHWEWPDPLTGITGTDFEKVARSDPQQRLAQGRAVEQIGSASAVAQGAAARSEDQADKAKIIGLLKAWLAAGSW